MASDAGSSPPSRARRNHANRRFNMSDRRNEPTVGIPPEQMGEVWPAAEPGTDPVLYGHVDFEPRGAFQARSLQTFRMVYTVGRYGIDDTGGIRVVFRVFGDGGHLQTSDPTAPNYVTAETSNNSGLRIDYQGRGSGRPRFKALTLSVRGGYLREGDTITITFGDTTGGSPGMMMQTFCESEFEFKVLADVCATGQYVPIPDSPAIAIVPGPPAVWRAVLPTLRRPGETFQFGLKAEDLWGNPTHLAQARLTLVPSRPVPGLPETVDYGPDEKARLFEGLRLDEPGRLQIKVFDAAERLLATSNPLIVRGGDMAAYWGDLHGQSGESIGINTAHEYFDFARNKSFLDATSHQANDFQVNNAFWQQINELTAAYQEDGRFVTFPGYEWSGNTAVGGDRNVYFRTEGRQIRRSSHALLSDRSDIHTDASDAAALFEALQDEDTVVFAHVGGRYADIAYAHDRRLETAMEIHSAWGTFEWLLTDGFTLGHRSGVVCNSDGHKGRPGASYPGAAQFGAYGGLTCFYARDLTRDGLFDCLRRRHHYGTTGNRLHLEVYADFASEGRLYETDPAVADTPPVPVRQVMMGDIAGTADETVTLRVATLSGSPIERIEVRNGTDVVQTLRGYGEADLGARIRVLWSGAEYRGRGRDTDWQGSVRFEGCAIRRMAKVNAWDHEKLLEQRGQDTIAFHAITTGNFGGFDAWLDEGDDAAIDIACNRVRDRRPLAEIGYDDTVHDAGGLRRRMTVFRLPEQNDCYELSDQVEVSRRAAGDNPLWVCVTTEDGFQAWSSPIFLFRTP